MELVAQGLILSVRRGERAGTDTCEHRVGIEERISGEFQMGPSLAIWVLIVSVLLWFFATDPLELSSLSGIEDFHAQYVPVPADNVLATIERDTESKLRASEIIGKGKFFGPESLAFDAQGRGPYTGVSDGSVVRYDGLELGWTTFATTTKTR